MKPKIDTNKFANDCKRANELIESIIDRVATMFQMKNANKRNAVSFDDNQLHNMIWFFDSCMRAIDEDDDDNARTIATIISSFTNHPIEQIDDVYCAAFDDDDDDDDDGVEIDPRTGRPVTT